MPKRSQSYFRPNSTINDDNNMEARYCRCIVHVAAKQPDWCLREKAWRQTRESRSCYNPYAVCTNSVGRTGSVECFTEYQLDQLPPEEVAALIILKEKKLREYKLPLTESGLQMLQDKLMDKFRSD